MDLSDRQRIGGWLRQRCAIQPERLEAASADASFRRYFRVHVGTRSWIVMDAPPQREDMRPFVRLAGELAALGLCVPEVLQADPGAGLYLLSDLGQQPYLAALDDDSAGRLYADALSALVTLAARGPRGLPRYDEPLLRRELALFPEWLLQRHLGLALDENWERRWAALQRLLVANALEQPQVLVHRDYHSRNLMVLAHGNPGILDFQDAVLGPLTYDPVSLLRDCYIAWPRSRVEAWALDYQAQVRDRGLLDGYDTSAGRFLRWFDLMGVQRQLKAAGIFARLWHRDGKPGYLADLPRTLGYIVEVAPDYPELADVGVWLRQTVLPRLAPSAADPGLRQGSVE